MVRVAVVGGSGNVGSRLAARLFLAGHDVVIAARNPGDGKVTKVVESIKAAEGAKSGAKASAADVAEAVASAEAVIVATPGYTTEAEWSKVVAPYSDFNGVVIDASNPLSAWLALELSSDQNVTSAGEELQKALPKAKVFKGFNTIGAELMTRPTIGGKQVSLLYAGPAEGKELAEKVIEAVGFKPIHVGPLRYARNLETIAELWVHLAIKQGWPRDGFAFDVQQA